ncbi:MAG: hypothetical protein BMS9Abin37_1912 [Acidobacteriota bacterium]|nr:MAG: hypothetical protein BMS9Abin37_1912 [Acidobacteriota bacterium]
MTLARARSLPAAARRPYVRRWQSAAAGLQPQVVPLIVLGLAVAAAGVASDWIAGAGVVVLGLIWFLLSMDGEPPVLPLAVSFQWVQVTCGVYYLVFTGRELEAHYASDYRPMVLIGLGCVTALTVGLAIGLKASRAQWKSTGGDNSFTVSWRTLTIAYLTSTFTNAILYEIAWSAPGLTQGLIAIGFVRLGVLFLMFRRLVRHRLRWEWFLGLLFIELMLGFTGYFASFREPLMLAVLALLEVFRPRSPAHWLRIAFVACLIGVTGLTWIGIRTVYRSEIDAGELTDSRVERLGRVGELSSEWFGSDASAVVRDLDRLVERLWVIYYPALAVSRVPAVLPHENGAIMQAALQHIVTPRILFPDKGVVASDSEMVRKYSGVFVASTEEGTSIAFGYAAESYVDFGLPWMFVPSIVFGIVMGSAYRAVFRVIHHRELAVGLACVVFWLTLYLFERSWLKTLGLSGTLLIYIGGLVFVMDRMLLAHEAKMRARVQRFARGRR